MKIKHALILLAFGYCLDFVAGLRKILHAPDANTWFILATVLKITGVILLVYKIITHPKAKEFMNW